MSQRSKKLIRSIVPWIVAIFFVLFVSALQIRNMRNNEGLWITFDDVHVARILAMADELKSGQFPVRLVNAFGNGGGYMLFTFYSPLVYYAGAFMVLVVGINPVNTVKLLFQASYIATGIGMLLYLYFGIRRSVILATLGAALLLVSPYFNYDAYARGALGELIAFALITWVFAFYALCRRYPSWLTTAVLAFVLGILILTHAITAFIALPTLALLFILELLHKRIKTEDIRYFVVAFIIGVGIATTYWLPMLLERSLISYDNSVFVAEGFTGTVKTWFETAGFVSRISVIKPVTLGWTLSLASMLALIGSWMVFYRRKLTAGDKPILLFLTVGWLCVLFLQLRISQMAWELLPFIKLVQFPYRYLTITTFLSIAGIVFALGLIKRRVVASILLGVLLLLTAWYYQPQTKPVGYYFANEHPASDACSTTTWDQEYLPKWVHLCVQKSNEYKAATVSGSVTLSHITSIEGGRDITVVASGSGVVYLNKYYYPGWTVSKGTATITPEIASDSGIMIVPINSTTAEKIRLTFSSTNSTRIADLISIISFLTALFMLVYGCYQLLRQQIAARRTEA